MDWAKMDWAREEALKQHGWKKCQCSGAWVRKHDELGKERRTEIVGGYYIPEYKRDANRIRALARKKVNP